MSKKYNSNFIIQGTILAAASIIVKIIGVVYRIPLTNILGQRGMAIYSVAFDVYTILLLISSYSLPIAVSKLVSARVAVGQMKNSYRIFIGAISFSSIAGIIAGVIAYCFSDALMVLWKSPESAMALKILAPALVIMSIVGVLRGYFNGLGTLIPTAFSNIIEQIANAIVSIVAAKYLYDFGKMVKDAPKNYSTAGAYGAAGGTLGTAVGAFIALLFLLFIFILYKKNIKKQNLRDRTVETESYGNIFKLLVITIIPVILSTTIYNISGFLDSGFFNNIMDIKGVEKEFRQTLLGAYTGEYRILMNLPTALAAALSSSIIPSIVTSVSQGNQRQVISKLDSAMRFSMIITIPCAVGMAVLASPIITLIFPTDKIMTVTETMMKLGAVSVIFYSISTITNSVLQGIDKMRLPVQHAFVSLIIHIILITSLLFATKLNIYVLVIADIIFPLIIVILNARSLRNYIGYKQEIEKTFLKPLICSLIMGIFAFLIYKILYSVLAKNFGHLMSNDIAAVITIVFSIIVYGVLLFLLKALDEDDLNRIPKGKRIASVAKKLHLMK